MSSHFVSPTKMKSPASRELSCAQSIREVAKISLDRNFCYLSKSVMPCFDLQAPLLWSNTSLRKFRCWRRHVKERVELIVSIVGQRVNQ